jgi:branched-chain amino acid transport system ATP-binding protein
MLELRNLTVNYGAIAALHGISLDVKQGDIVTLIGGNGAGKTTTLKAISGLLRTHSGEVMYQGRNIANLPPHQIVKLGISHVPEGRMIFANLTVLENLRAGAYLQFDRETIQREMDYVFNIFPRLQERVKQVAGRYNPDHATSSSRGWFAGVYERVVGTNPCWRVSTTTA